jgi:hypothetical protein
MSNYRFIKASAALGVAAMATSAFAGDVTRIDVNFSNVDYWSADQGGVDPTSPNYNGQNVAAQEGRNLSSFGASNVDIDVCWNTGATYENWASECSMALYLTDGTAEGELFYILGSLFEGNDTGPTAVGTCLNFLAPTETVTAVPPLTYFITNSTDVAVVSTYNDGTATRAGTVNNVDFYFELAAPTNPACVDAIGSCAEVHPTPGCSDAACCVLACDPALGGDPFCCETEWDQNCVNAAIALCGIFQYECATTGASPANDCATSPTPATNGTVYAFDTTNANTDGPDEIDCGSADEDLPIWSDIWYTIDCNTDGFLTATCCNTADFDTKIAVYNAGVQGSTFDPAELPSSFIGCNEDCADDAVLFTSELVVPVSSGNQYLIRLGGFAQAVGTGDIRIDIDEPAAKLPPQVCTEPGLDPVTQSDSLDITANSGVLCPAGDNYYARTYSKAELGGGTYAINCINFGVDNDGSYVPGVINLYVSQTQVPVTADLIILATNPFGIYTTVEAGLVTVSFADPVCVDLADGEYLVVEMICPPVVGGNGVTFNGSATDNTGLVATYIKAANCGLADYGTLEGIGFPNQWTVEVSGTNNCSDDPGCPGDFDGNGGVDGGDFGLILSKWGACPAPCPEDLDNNGEVNGADVGLLLTFWGTCP